MSKRFTLGALQDSALEQPVFKQTWPELQPKLYAAVASERMEALEEKIIRQAKEKLALMEKEAYEKGFSQGEKDGLELGEKRLEATVRQFEKLLQQIEQYRKTLDGVYEQEMLHLIFSLCRRILHHELILNKEVVADSVREAFQHVVDRRNIAIHVNPTDYQYLLGHSEALPIVLDPKTGVRLMEDPSIGRGGCLLETAFGEIDATIESQFDQIASAVWEQLKQRGRLSGT